MLLRGPRLGPSKDPTCKNKFERLQSFKIVAIDKDDYGNIDQNSQEKIIFTSLNDVSIANLRHYGEDVNYIDDGEFGMECFHSNSPECKSFVKTVKPGMQVVGFEFGYRQSPLDWKPENF